MLITTSWCAIDDTKMCFIQFSRYDTNNVNIFQLQFYGMPSMICKYANNDFRGVTGFFFHQKLDFFFVMISRTIRPPPISRVRDISNLR